MFVRRLIPLIVCLPMTSLFGQELSQEQKLVLACHRLDLDSVVQLLRSGVNVNATFGDGDTRAHFQDQWSGGWPVAASQWTPVHALANSSRFPDPPTPFENTNERLDWSRETRKRVPQVEIDDRDKKRIAILQILLSHDCNINTADDRGATPLYDALSNEHEKMAMILLQFDPKINTKTGIYIDGVGDITPLHRALWSPELTKRLLEKGADPDAKDTQGESPRDWARSSGDKKLLKFFESR